MRIVYKICMVLYCLFLMCSFLYAKEEQGIVIVVQDNKQENIPGVSMRIIGEKDTLIGVYTSDASGSVKLPFLAIGEYRIELETIARYTRQETTTFSITAYNQHAKMKITLSMNEKVRTHAKSKPSLLVFFCCIVNGVAYLLIYGFYKEMFPDIIVVRGHDKDW